MSPAAEEVTPSAKEGTPSARDTGCPFCAIVIAEEAGESGVADLVLATETCVAFLDRRPVFKGHTLVVPRRHLVTLPDLPADLLAPFLRAVQRVASAMPQALGAQGTFVAMNNVVSQSVAHLHAHVVPRTKGDGLRGFFWPRTTYSGPEESAEYARRLRRAIAVAETP